jgi:hypothetical protein
VRRQSALMYVVAPSLSQSTRSLQQSCLTSPYTRDGRATHILHRMADDLSYINSIFLSPFSTVLKASLAVIVQAAIFSAFCKYPTRWREAQQQHATPKTSLWISSLISIHINRPEIGPAAFEIGTLQSSPG